MKVTFFAKNIKVVKTKFHNKTSIESQIERFRQDMLCKYEMLFNGVPHIIKIED